MFKTLALSAFLVIPTLAVSQGAPPCYPRDQFTAVIEQREESRQSSMVTTTGNLVEVWVDTNTNNWLISMTSAAGLTCLVAWGTDYTEENTQEGDL